MFARGKARTNRRKEGPVFRRLATRSGA
jgi:hypothetical protein